MCAVSGVRGIPDYGNSLPRPRLSSLAEELGGRPLIVVGSSGSGKSVLARQLADRGTQAAVWVDCAGSGIRPTQVRDSLFGLSKSASARAEHDPGDAAADSLASINAFLVERAESEGVTLVLDDLGSASHADLDWLRELGRVAWLCSSRLIVTTKSISDWPAAIACDWSVIDGAELALVADESRELASMLNFVAPPDEIERMREACAGHVAFFSAMAAQARIHGASMDSARTPSLNGWLLRSIRESLDEEDHQALCAASLLHTGDEADLVHMGFGEGDTQLCRLAAQLPLVRIQARDSRSEFIVHDLVEAYFRKSEPELCRQHADAAIAILTNRNDYVRAAAILGLHGRADSVVSWLRRNGQVALNSSHYESILRLISVLPTSSVMKHSSVMVMWARALLETGQVEDALAKARAARPLAQHERDHQALREAIVVIINGLRMLGRIEEACALAEEVIHAKGEPHVDAALLAEALLCVGAAKIMSGELDSAEEPLLSAINIADSITGDTRLGRMARNAMALVPTLIHGDFLEGKRVVSPFAELPIDTPRVQLMFRGNLAVYLTELGRYSRAEVLIRGVLHDTARYGLQVMDGSYLPVLGTTLAAAGDLTGGVQEARRGIAVSEEYGDTAEAAVNRTYLASMLLAHGQAEESLAEAERAFEALAMHNTMGYARMAALGIAAAMLLLGDASAARSWVATAEEFGPSQNKYQNLRAALVLAAADWRDGSTADAEKRLSGFADYIRSENANWQIAIFTRCFPELLGMVCAAVGSHGMPSHMLAMIPREIAESALVVAESQLDPDQWVGLGTRLLGRAGMEALIRRGHAPYCHVRLFGGLEVTIGGRLIREGDWKKRKARLLFAVLVLDQGKGVSRDKILEHLWPGMEQERAQGNLYVIWSTMKRVLIGPDHGGERCPYVLSVGGLCQVETDVVRSDVADFEAALAAAATLRASDRPNEAIPEYRKIMELYRGELLPADCYDDWFSSVRQFYAAEFLDAMLQAGELVRESGEPVQALSFLRRGLLVDPNREDLYQSVLKCQIAAGMRSSAIDTYFQCRSQLAEELGLDPSAETQALYTQILAMEEPQTYGDSEC